LRAVATDRGGRTDPAPASIIVTYGDATAPARPRDLTARVDGVDVQLAWSPGPEPDIEGDSVFRDHERLAHVPATDPTAIVDSGVALGRHEYEITALDGDGNESAASEAAEALVYAVSLEPPYPVTTETRVSLEGSGSREGTTVQILREDVAIGESPAAAEVFSVPDVPLIPGANLLKARGRDAAGNRSVPSDEVVLISNAPPAGVTGLSATVTGHDVGLEWNAVGDEDLFGYEVRRGADALTGSNVRAPASVDASSSRSGAGPGRASDGNPGTVWVPAAGDLPAEWVATFDVPILVDHVTLRFG